MAAIRRYFGLSSESGSFGLKCDNGGVWLAGVPLLQMTGTGFMPRPTPKLKALIEKAYGGGIYSKGLFAGLNVVADALNRGNLGRAMIAAVHLRLPELDWDGADRLTHANYNLSKYDPDEPRDWRGRWTIDGGINPSDSDETNLETLIPAAYNGRFHDQVVASMAKYLRSVGQIVQTEVRFQMADGSQGARLDILAKDPLTNVVYGIEVKTGDRPGFTEGQIAVYPHIMWGGSVVELGGKAIALGLPPQNAVDANSNILDDSKRW